MCVYVCVCVRVCVRTCMHGIPPSRWYMPISPISLPSQHIQPFSYSQWVSLTHTALELVNSHTNKLIHIVCNTSSPMNDLLLVTIVRKVTIIRYKNYALTSTTAHEDINSLYT